METPPRYRNHHTGGDPKFGKDGLLYVTVGDAGAQSLGWPQDLGKLAGKLVRLTDNGGIPPSNPYTGTGTARCNVAGVPPSGSPAGDEVPGDLLLRAAQPLPPGRRPQRRRRQVPRQRRRSAHLGGDQRRARSRCQLRLAAAGRPVRQGLRHRLRPPPAGHDRPGPLVPPRSDGGAATGAAFVPNGLWPARTTVSTCSATTSSARSTPLRPGGPDCRLCSPPTSAYIRVEFATVPQAGEHAVRSRERRALLRLARRQRSAQDLA